MRHGIDLPPFRPGLGGEDEEAAQSRSRLARNSVVSTQRSRVPTERNMARRDGASRQAAI